MRFYRDPPRYSALRLCPSFREGQPPGRGRCTRPGVRPGCSSGLRLPWGSASCPVVTSGRKDPGRIARADGRDPITSDHFPERRRSRAAQGQINTRCRWQTICPSKKLPSVSPVTAPGGRVSIRSHAITSGGSSPAGPDRRCGFVRGICTLTRGRSAAYGLRCGSLLHSCRQGFPVAV